MNRLIEVIKETLYVMSMMVLPAIALAFIVLFIGTTLNR